MRDLQVQDEAGSCLMITLHTDWVPGAESFLYTRQLCEVLESRLALLINLDKLSWGSSQRHLHISNTDTFGSKLAWHQAAPSPAGLHHFQKNFLKSITGFPCAGLLHRWVLYTSCSPSSILTCSKHLFHVSASCEGSRS